MNICLVGVEYPKDTDFGGISTYQFLLSQALTSMGHKVSVICGTEKDDYEYYDHGIHVIRLHTMRWEETIDTYDSYRKKIKETILKLHQKEKIDLIETPEFSGEIVEFLKRRDIPVVVKLHTSYTIWSHLNQIQLPKPLHSHIMKNENLVLRYSDQVISCSELLKNMMPQYHSISSIDSIKVIGNPANIQDFYPTPNNHQSHTILFCGSLERRKGIFVLAKAIPIIAKEVNDDSLRFQLIGNDTMIDRHGISMKELFLKQIPKKYHSMIEFVGVVPNRELNPYFNQACIGVVPSLFDNLPYVAMEELLTELPIVASSNTGIREMIVPNESGILYSPNDYKALAKGVIDLYLQPEIAKKMGQKGRKGILKKYSPAVIAKKNIKVYQDVIHRFEKNHSKMHVCLVNFEYPKDTIIGGISTYQKRIADALVANHCKVTVICGSWGEGADYYEDGIHVIRVPKHFPYQNLGDYYSYRKRISNLIKEIDLFDKIDVIESPELSAEMITFAKNPTIPLVTKLHTSYTLIKKFNNETAMFPEEVERVIYRNENSILDLSDKVICCSQILKDLMPAYHKMKNFDDIIVVGNPANVDDFYPTAPYHESNTILYCGKVIERKGVFVLAKAIPLIIERLKDYPIRFQVVGDYLCVEQQNVVAKDVFLSQIPKKYHSYIEFTGVIPNEELNPYFNQARIGIMPSLFDNLPYVAMEELLTELPLVASSNTGIREMIVDHESGLLYDPDDYEALAEKVVYLFLHPEIAKEMGKKGRKEILKKYSPDVIAKKNIEIYQEAIKHFHEKKEIQRICQELDFSNIRMMKHGVANPVIRCEYQGKKVIVKFYHRLKTYDYAFIQKVLEQDISCNKCLDFYTFDTFHVGIFSYVPGKMIRYFTKNQIHSIFTECEKIHSLKIPIQTTIFDKVNTYYQSLKDSKDKITQKVIQQYQSLTIDYSSNNRLLHGDLVYSNILWCPQVTFIDFDEVIFGPIEYELASFLIKNCFENGSFDLAYGKKIISFYKNRGYSLDTIHQYYLFYIIKVLLEKLYFSQLYSLDLEDSRQKNDYWYWWYQLLQDSVLEKELFQ